LQRVLAVGEEQGDETPAFAHSSCRKY
jgi:hypothetical protein